MSSSIQPIVQQTVIATATTMLGGPLGQIVGTALQGAQTLGQLQQLQTLVDTAKGQVEKALGSINQAGQGQVAPQPGCISPGAIAVIVMNDPLGQLAQLGNSGGGGASNGGVVKHAKAPLVGDSQWPAFSDAANNRCSGHNPLFNGTNPWNKSGAARDEAALVGWAMQKTDNVQYDTDRKMFYQTNTNGTKTDIMSLDDLKKVADGAGGISQNNGAAFDAVGKALDQASAKATNPPQPSFEQLIQMLSDLIKKLTGQAGGAAAGASAGAAGGAGAPSGTSSSSSTGGTGSGSASGASGPAGGFSTSNEGGWGKIDSMMAEAEKLSTSDKQSDQLKAQKMMQQAQRMFEMISKMLEQMSQMLSKSIQAWK